MIYLCYSLRSPCFKAVVETFSKILSEYGIQNKIVHETDKWIDDTYIIWWPHINYLPKNSIIYNMDPMIEDNQKQFFQLLNSNKEANVSLLEYSYSEKNFKFYNDNNLRYDILPYGISPYQYNPIHEHDEKTIDILFYGGFNDKRNKGFQTAKFLFLN